MKLYLPDTRECKSIITALLVFALICIAGLLMRLNDWTHGHLGRFFERVTNFLTNLVRRKQC